MKEFQMFFFDVDGTLLDNRSHRISPAVIEALHTLQQRGKKIVISSGRDVHTIMSMPQLAAIQWDGYICRNGSVVADQHQNELFRYFFDLETMHRLEEVSQKLASPIQYMGHTDWLNLPPTEDFRAACAFFHRDPNAIEIRPTLPDEQATMALAFDKAQSDYTEYRQIPGLTVLPTPFHYADLVAKGIDKSTGITLLCQHLNLDPRDTMAFGDGINDLEMLQAAGIGVAMGQGRDEIKAIADYVSDSVEKDGIVSALKAFGQI
ncbi:HAD family hydrolase [Holdemania massiliensis]|uniref:HAD family hydrolase n=1 Tax=Holdemania massiliensis TaxID=1468449 RepID=UPI001F05DCCA|nr:HAD family hydrolase [Holdemania massiliensis]MCH1941189.1 HAD family hydrolase [Holdemania massiliensis]